MNQFCKHLITEWRRLEMPFENETLVMAVSGGADSVSLLLALEELRRIKKINLRLVIAHFNHGLRGKESQADEDFVKTVAGKYKFELTLGKSAISKQGNLEQNARIARYRFLVETANRLRSTKVLTGHTLNDQAETFLINLIRGSGLEGLGGMKAIRPLDENRWQKTQAEIRNPKPEIPNPKSPGPEIRLIRPLLGWAKREMTEKYCREREVEYRYDTMNEDTAFKRVRIRKVLLPLLRDFNPKIIDTLARTAFLLQEDFEALEKAADLGIAGFENLLPENRGPELALKDLRGLFPSMRRKILRDWLRDRRGDLRGLDADHFEAVDNLIFSRKSGRMVELPGGQKVKKKGGRIVFMKDKG
ncbi:MAG: tRNA lysidine(34) synthetase TilS [Pyrinomonadaceae bacterium]